MEKRIAIFLLSAILTCLAAFGNPVIVKAKSDPAISQVDVYLPDMYVYMEGDLGDGEINPRILETDCKLTVKSSGRFKDTKRKVFYHILLDISDSVSSQQLEDMKDSIIALKKKMGDADKLEVITFADQVKTILKGDESTDQVKKVLKKVKKGKKTHLYEGINALSDSVAKEKERVIKDDLAEDEIMRNVGVILTDWQEVKKAGGQTSREEALKKIQKTGTPLYGYCLTSAKVSLQDDMGVFLRETGGNFNIFKSDKKNQLVGLNKELKNQMIYTIRSSSNKTYPEEKTMEIEMGDKSLKKEHLYLNTTRKDDKKPEITSVEQKGDDAKVLYVTFSEDVIRADNKNNYSILRSGKYNYTVSEATYTSDNEVYQAKLILNDNLTKGDYEVSVVNVTDNTNEENILDGTWSGHLDGEGALKAFYNKLGKFWALLVLAAVLLILFIIYRFIKKHRGIMVVEDKMILGSNMENKQHVKNDDESTKNVVLLISGIPTESNRMDTQINSSIIVGRSSICDIYFDDLSMSRQHFAIEVDKGDLYITDLESKGGTWVNGKRIEGRTRLESGSEIKAGSVSINISW